MHDSLPVLKLKEYLQQVEPFKQSFDRLKFHTIITDADAHILYINNAGIRETGYSSAECIGKNPGDLWGGEMPKAFYEKMWHTIKIEKQPFVGEVHNVKKDGTEYWQELYISPLLDEQGSVKFFIGIEPNITDKKKQEEFRKEFISILAHQSRQPLAAMNWTLELLLEYGELNPEQSSQVKDVYGGTNNLINLVNDLLLLSRLEETGDTVEEEESLELVTEITGMMKTLEDSQKEISFNFIHDEAPFALRSNKLLTEQVLINLISNAANYADGKNPKVGLTLQKTDTTYEFSVSNNGLSINEEDKPKIFERFFRAEEAKIKKKSGTGLGLYIVKLVCDHLRWSVWFESPGKEGMGTTFFVSIPIKSVT